MIVITGATGHLGNVLVRQLLDRGERVRVLVHHRSSLTSLENLDVEKVRGDICNIDSLENAFKGADTVYHLAAMVKIVPGYEKQLQAINVEGTKNVLQACKTNDVRRLIYSSSSHVFGSIPHGTTITEETPIVPSKTKKGYIRSKAQATLDVLKAAKDGLDAVIAIPSGILGPFDFMPSHMGRMCIEANTFGRSFYIDGGYNFADVRDVASGFISMAEKGIKGEMYLLTGEFFSDWQALNLLSRELGTLAPKYKIPPWLAYPMSYLSILFHKVSGGPDPLLSPQAVGEVVSNSSFSSAKAKNELGFKSRDVETSLTDGIHWLKERGMI